MNNENKEKMTKEEAVRKHLNILPEPERALALSRVDPEYIEENNDFDPYDPKYALYAGFNWHESPEGFGYWADLNKRYHELVQNRKREEEAMNEEISEDNGTDALTWFEELPEPYRTQAKRNCESESDLYPSINDALSGGFSWKNSPEGYDYWEKLDKALAEKGVSECILSDSDVCWLWLHSLPEPYRTQAKENFDIDYVHEQCKHIELVGSDRVLALEFSFDFFTSPEGKAYWFDVRDRLDNKEPLKTVPDIVPEDENSHYSRTTTQTVLPKGEPLFSEKATKISIVDEAGGEFLRIEQDKGAICIDPEEWTAVRDVISRMVGEIWDHQQKEGENGTAE